MNISDPMQRKFLFMNEIKMRENSLPDILVFQLVEHGKFENEIISTRASVQSTATPIYRYSLYHTFATKF